MMVIDRSAHAAADARSRATVDAKLVNLAVAGSAAAFEALVVRYRAQVVHAAYRVSHDEDEANDVAQDAFLRAYRSLSSFRADRPFSGWLFKIARNASLDALRRKRRAENIAPLVSMEGVPQPGTEEIVLRQDDAARVRAALAGLPHRHRAVLELYYVKGLRYREIAETLEMPLGTVKTYISRAKHRLRDTLGTDSLEAAA